ncbi:MAG: hypothetical protein CVU38_09530 [Chloroflexi bacterium HGW-Chloroflexi-1]|nr:MAG: hypothetical protein CVU38_09530 [Chloroflexi bacterium HGW-Chloroflexi-1]
MPGSLLTEVLRLLNEGGIHSTAELARRLDTREALVAAMAEDLAGRGYLELLADDCATACDGCALSGSCAMPGEPGAATRTFALTTKGRRAVT